MREIVPTNKTKPEPEPQPTIHWVLEFPGFTVDETQDGEAWYAEYKASSASNEDENISFNDWVAMEMQERIDEDPYDVFIEWFNTVTRVLESQPRLYVDVDMNGAK